MGLSNLPLGDRVHPIKDDLTVLIRKVQVGWFKVLFLGEVETAVVLGMKSGFADSRLCKRDSIGSLASFNTRTRG